MREVQIWVKKNMKTRFKGWRWYWTLMKAVRCYWDPWSDLRIDYLSVCTSNLETSPGESSWVITLCFALSVSLSLSLHHTRKLFLVLRLHSVWTRPLSLIMGHRHWLWPSHCEGQAQWISTWSLQSVAGDNVEQLCTVTAARRASAHHTPARRKHVTLWTEPSCAAGLLDWPGEHRCEIELSFVLLSGPYFFLSCFFTLALYINFH